MLGRLREAGVPVPDASPLGVLFHASWAGGAPEALARPDVLAVSLDFPAELDEAALAAQMAPELRDALLRHCRVLRAPALAVLDGEGALLAADAAAEGAPASCAALGAAFAAAFPPPAVLPPEEAETAPASELFETAQFGAAAAMFLAVIAREPDRAAAHYNLGVLFQTLGLPQLAVRHLVRVVELDPSDATAHSVLSSVLHPAAPELVEEQLRLLVARQPENRRAAHSLAKLTNGATTADPEYVREVFDHLADTFESKLVEDLKYRVPWQLRDGVKAVSDDAAFEAAAWRVVDLGCGTGLCGPLFRPAAAHILGVDLSPLMVDKTRECGAYDAAEVADLHDTLEGLADGATHLVLAADVFIYVGDVDRCFALCRSKLARSGDGGLLAFSVEEGGPDGGFMLAPSGRFKHSQQYVRDVAQRHGFEQRFKKRVVVRYEQTEPIWGWVYVVSLV